MRLTCLLLLALLGGCSGDLPPATPTPTPPPPHTQRLGEGAGFAWTMRYEPEILSLVAICHAETEFDNLGVRTLFKDEGGRELIGGESLTSGSCAAGSQAFSQEQQAIWPEGGTLDITVTHKTAAGDWQKHWGLLKRDGKIVPQP